MNPEKTGGSILSSLITTGLHNVEKWVTEHNYKGYEPFDGLSSYLRPLTFRITLLEQILQQVIRRSPFNLRPILGVKPKDSTKGRGYMAWGYCKMYQLTGEEVYKNKAVSCLEWLMENNTKKYEHYSWGNHFHYASRGGKLPLFEPTIVWTSLIGQTFLDGYEILGDEKYLEVAKSICEWIVELPREVTDYGTCLSYVTYTQSSIHNSNMLGAAMLSRTANIVKNEGYLELAHSAMEYSCTRQLNNGAWYYGHAPKYHWIDNFHTGYNLDSLKRYTEYTDDKTFDEHLEKGYYFFRDHFFEESGLPKYYYNNPNPLDIQCASQAIDTLVYFSDYDSTALEIAKKVAEWTITNMQDDSGYFYFRLYPMKKVKIPMIHWGQATMFKALSALLLKLNHDKDD